MPSPVDHFQFTLINGPNIPGSYAILFFTASDFTFITRQIHNWTSFPLWFNLIIPSEAISVLLPSSIFQCHIFLPFHTAHGALKAKMLKWFAILFSSGPCFVRTHHHDPSILGGPTPKRLTPQEIDPDLPMSVQESPTGAWVGSGLLQGQGLWVRQAWVWHKPCWRRSPLTPP